MTPPRNRSRLVTFAVLLVLFLSAACDNVDGEPAEARFERAELGSGSDTVPGEARVTLEQAADELRAGAETLAATCPDRLVVIGSDCSTKDCAGLTLACSSVPRTTRWSKASGVPGKGGVAPRTQFRATHLSDAEVAFTSLALREAIYWFLDCDRDTFAPLNAIAQLSMIQPPDLNGCGWTDRWPFNDGTFDCNDLNAAVHPEHPEICDDGLDNDCDGIVDNHPDAVIWYLDCDDDGYAVQGAVSSEPSCAEPEDPAYPNCGWTTRAPNSALDQDCNDADARTNPGAAEIIGDEIDQTCDGRELCYQDVDSDQYHGSASILSADTDCRDGNEAVAAMPGNDCDDRNAAINPGATERAGDNIDQNCDNRELCYRNSDNDGYRTGTTFLSTDADCNDSGEALSSKPSGDCCDSDAAAYPGASSYHSTANRCASWDYNCNNLAEPRWLTTESCRWEPFTCYGATGSWNGSIPGCGQTRPWYYNCLGNGAFSCSYQSAENRQQLCR